MSVERVLVRLRTYILLWNSDKELRMKSHGLSSELTVEYEVLKNVNPSDKTKLEVKGEKVISNPFSILSC